MYSLYEAKTLMRYFFTILAFACLFPASGQYFWSRLDNKESHNKSHYTCHALMEDSMIVVGGVTNTVQCENHSLAAYSLSGELLWQNAGSFDAVTVTSGSIFTAGYEGGGDVVGYEWMTLSKYDRNGSVIFQVDYPEVPHDGYPFSFIPNSIEVLESDHIFITAADGIIRANAYGIILSADTVNLTHDLTGIQQLSKNSFILTTTDKLYRSDSSYHLTDSITFGHPLLKSTLNNDTIFSLLDHFLIRLDSNLQIIDTLFSSQDVNLNAFEIRGNEIWIQGFQNDVIKVYQMMEATGTDTLEFDQLMEVNGFSVADTTYIFTGTSYSGQTGLYSYNLKNDPQPILLPDIEIIDFHIDSIVIQYADWIKGELPPYAFMFDSEFTIRNNGPDTLNSFSIYYDLRGGFNCGQNFHFENHSGLALPPGRDLTIKTERRLSQEYYGGNSNICVEVLAPNGILEINTGDNLLCKSFEITGTNEVSENSNMSIYPNPASQTIVVSAPGIENDQGTITIYGITGHQVASFNCDGNQMILPVNHMADGIYLLKLTSDREAIVKRFVVRK